MNRQMHLRFCEAAAYRHDAGREDALRHDGAKQVLQVRREPERHCVGGVELWDLRGEACTTHTVSSMHTNKGAFPYLGGSRSWQSGPWTSTSGIEKEGGYRGKGGTS